VLSYAQAIVTAFTINCPESASTVLHDLKEIGPSYFFAPPRIWESILTNVMIRIEDAAWLKRRLVKFFLGVAQDLERARLSEPAALGVAAPALSARPPARLRAASRQPRHAPDPRRLHGRRGHRLRDLRLLPRARHQRQAALWHDRGERVRRRPEGWRRAPGHGGHANAPGGDQDLRAGRSHVPRARRLPGLLQEPGGDGGHAERRLDPLGRRGLPRRLRPSQDHRSRQRRGPAGPRHAVRAQVSREQAQVLAVRQRSRLHRTDRPFVAALVNIDLGAVGNWPSAATSPTRATPTSARSPRSTTSSRARSGV